MRNASAALIALLNGSDQFDVADCLTIVQQDGTVTRLTNESQPVTVVSQYDNVSHTFTPFPFTRGMTKLVIGTEIDDLEITLSPNPVTDLLNGIPWPAAAVLGAFDNAEILLEKCIMATFGITTPGTLILFWGIVGSPELSRSSVVLKVQSELNILQAQFPRNVYQPGCLNSLFDAQCGLSRAVYLVTGAVTAGSTVSSINTNLAAASTRYDLGTITFTSGVNDGVSRLVRSYVHTGGVVVPVPALKTAPANGDTFEIVPGCDKKITTCDTKYTNLVGFRGFPVIPAAESAR